jgi:ribosome-associated toxin RatA of RatAB toxin-antitoxin module
MPERVSKEVVVGVPVAAFWAVIADYARYGEFVPGIHGCRVVRTGEGGVKEVEYDLDLGVKRVKYVLRHVEEPPRRMAWSLASGDLMKVSNGSWELSEAPGGKTRARYTVEVQVAKPPFVPQAFIDKVTDEMTKVSLPRNLDAFKARAEKLAAGHA